MPDAHQCPPMPNSARIISPHGTFTSVWSLFLRPGAIVYELTASCYLYTWLPVPYLTRGRLWQPVPHLKKPSTQLSLRHVYLSWRLSDEAKARQTGIQRKAGNWSGPLLELVHPKTGSSSSSSSVYHIPDRPGTCGLQASTDFSVKRGVGVRDPQTGRATQRANEPNEPRTYLPTEPTNERK